MLIVCLAMGGALFAQSKTELKEQIDTLNAQVETLKAELSTSKQESARLQSTINMLERQIAELNRTISAQNTSLSSYAEQVERLNKEITNLSTLVNNNMQNTSPHQKAIVFSNANNTFKVPAGKIWRIRDFSEFQSTIFSNESMLKNIEDPNYRWLLAFYTRIGNTAINVPNQNENLYLWSASNGGRLNENTEFKLEIWFIKNKTNYDEYPKIAVKDHIAPDNIQCILYIEEYDIE